jgi:hypothetical protein
MEENRVELSAARGQGRLSIAKGMKGYLRVEVTLCILNLKWRNSPAF